ncbi:glycosyltransferase [Marinobacter sp. BGYM27]|uniref:glycosyltransferase n=1 Tax=Marinobacter sp. BGYM27 TaxID=2975597 RepID=UPI0021A5D779|nr:glycosyltransferase [Marinobacter sp. BGYM27]MDG5499006.1 glycosyltransferase [Marinobacter sp. BGYM27]
MENSKQSNQNTAPSKVIHGVHWKHSGIYEVVRTLLDEAEPSRFNQDMVVINDYKFDFFSFIKFVKLLFLIVRGKQFYHAHSFLLYLLVLFAWSKKSAITFHNDYPYLTGVGLRDRLKRRLIRSIIKIKSPVVTCVGRNLSNKISSIFNCEVIFIQNPVNKKYISQFQREYSDGAVFGSVGRLADQKNYRRLIKAFSFYMSHLISSKKNAYLCIAGEGDERDLIESSIKESGLGDNIRLKGFVDDVPQFYASIDVYICTSLYEGFGLSIVEAMLMGKPVISTKVGVFLDFDEFYYLKIDNGKDERSIFKAMKKFSSLTQEDIIMMIESNKLLCTKLFSPSHIFKIYSDLVWSCRKI